MLSQHVSFFAMSCQEVSLRTPLIAAQTWTQVAESPEQIPAVFYSTMTLREDVREYDWRCYIHKSMVYGFPSREDLSTKNSLDYLSSMQCGTIKRIWEEATHGFGAKQNGFCPWGGARFNSPTPPPVSTVLGMLVCHWAC